MDKQLLSNDCPRLLRNRRRNTISVLDWGIKQWLSFSCRRLLEGAVKSLREGQGTIS
jgi:hypothetical protein